MTDEDFSLTHLKPDGDLHMVDVGDKAETIRRATARARVRMNERTLRMLSSGTTPKGDVLAAARIAGIQAAKLTPQLIPLCHTVRLTRVEVSVRLTTDAAVVDATAEARDRTGVEMEAMVAASAAALTLYDMLKAVDREMSFEVQLIEKLGGRSGHWTRPASEDRPDPDEGVSETR